MTAASAAQLEIWLADRCEPESGRYNIPVCLEFRGGLDDRALRAALADVLERHPAPAGRFETVEGTLRHTADPDAAVPLHLAVHPGGYDREVALADAARSAERPLDPGTAPLLRAEVLRFDDGALVTVTVHHLVADGRSVEVLTEDLITAYRARHTGRDPASYRCPCPSRSPWRRPRPVLDDAAGRRSRAAGPAAGRVACRGRGAWPGGLDRAGAGRRQAGRGAGTRRP